MPDPNWGRSPLGEHEAHRNRQLNEDLGQATNKLTNASDEADMLQYALGQIEHWFTYHPPRNVLETHAYEAIRVAGKMFAMTIVLQAPPGPDRTTSILRVREAVMLANAAVACQGR